MEHIKILKIETESELTYSKVNISHFIHHQLGKYHDSLSAIKKAINYALHRQDGSFLYLATLSSKLVGVLVNYCFENQNEIIYLAVIKEHRKQGIGRMLLQQILKSRYVHLHVHIDNPAKKFYQKMGFVEHSERFFYSYMVFHNMQ
ncbi:GNAT family N-acetyltransferase [Candidatus Uabimicrobium amorphum]|uniref:N-acetyltransferase domain-containing protein n=2 Tax=Uabimicrobium amorphum TaxID=2596890 RepID=A0A5S9F4W3_UABAM|nr:hypothetical protein UABAM_04368 [Candidatus Uabimicrobium amorphum]